jgi:hypothetical protein
MADLHWHFMPDNGEDSVGMEDEEESEVLGRRTRRMVRIERRTRKCGMRRWNRVVGTWRTMPWMRLFTRGVS